LIGVKIVPKRVKGFGEKKVVTIIQKKIDEIDDWHKKKIYKKLT
jgi:hypothetical protein